MYVYYYSAITGSSFSGPVRKPLELRENVRLQQILELRNTSEWSEYEYM